MGDQLTPSSENNWLKFLSDSTELVKMVYQDLAQPSIQKIGKALEAVFEYGECQLLPLRLQSEMARATFQRNTKKLMDQINEIPEEKVHEIPPQLLLPAFEKFSYITDDDLSDLFVNLIATAANSDTLSNAHPGFLQMIDRLSPDEARILNLLKSFKQIPFVKIQKYQKNGSGFFDYISYFTGIEKIINLNFSNNIRMFVDNLQAMGIIQDVVGNFLINLENYTLVINNLMDYIIDCPLPNDEKYKEGLGVQRGYFKVSNFGDKFINACTKKISSIETNFTHVICNEKNGFKIDEQINHKIYGNGKIFAINSNNNVCISFAHDELKIFDNWSNILKV